jgi:hypothetical protein
VADDTMPVDDVAELVRSLTPQEREAVRQFIRFLKGEEDVRPSTFAEAVDEFIAAHPDLLRRLAQ